MSQQQQQQQIGLKINNGNNDFSHLTSKFGFTVTLGNIEKENVNMQEEETDSVSTKDDSHLAGLPGVLKSMDKDKMDMDGDVGPSAAVGDNNDTMMVGHPLLTESRVTEAIKTLEALLKTESKPAGADADTNPHTKLLKRLKGTARAVVVRGIVSKRDQRHKIQQLLAQHDETVAKRKGIRLLRGFKAKKVNEHFQKRDETQETVPLPLPSPLPKVTTTADHNERSSSSTSAYEHKFECYICKSFTFTSHHFYDQMCCKCGDINFIKRTQTGSLHGLIALVTGGRIKIGYETALMLLRAGAHVVVTTRFPHDAAFRYSKETDYNEWKHRLDIYGVDFRFLRMVESFCVYMNQHYVRLDILIQNAAQTIRRPVKYYEHLLEFEARGLPIELQGLVKEFGASRVQDQKTLALEFQESSPANQPSELIQVPVPHQLSSLTSSSGCSQLLVHPEDTSTPSHLIPSGIYDEHHQQLDLRPETSWILQLDQVDTAELVEVQLVNSVAPFVILNKLTPLMAKDRTGGIRPGEKSSLDGYAYGYGWIIMVSSMEGKFTRPYKTTAHPHTNMAKAALNMIVRTSACYYKSKYGLLMNAVDTGWVTDEDPVPLQSMRRTKFHPPLDEIDGAARVLDPIFQTLNEGAIVYGAFLKDYSVSTW